MEKGFNAAHTPNEPYPSLDKYNKIGFSLTVPNKDSK
jgi:hypothetical protein